MSKNKHGLGRNIPDKVKQVVRSKSKQGCVLCRSLIYDYHHFNPEFSEATEHNPNGICLLCTQCHREVHQGRISNSMIERAYHLIDKDGDARPPLYSPTFAGSLKLTLGDGQFEHMARTANILVYDGEPILQVTYVKDEIFGGSRPSISGRIFDINGEEVLSIKDNEIAIVKKDTNIFLKNETLKINDSIGNSILSIIFSPPNGIHINGLRMRYREVLLEMSATFGMTLPTILGGYYQILVGGIRSQGARYVFSYTSDKTRWHDGTLRIAPGQGGISIPHTGGNIADGGSIGMPRLILKPVTGYALRQ